MLRSCRSVRNLRSKWASRLRRLKLYDRRAPSSLWVRRQGHPRFRLGFCRRSELRLRALFQFCFSLRRSPYSFICASNSPAVRAGTSCAVAFRCAIPGGRGVISLTPGREFVGGDPLGEIDRRQYFVRGEFGKLLALKADDLAHVTPPDSDGRVCGAA